MPMIHRRSFLERLSLGAGAVVLSPIVNTLVSEARGALPVRKRFIVVTYPNGYMMHTGIPVEFNGAEKGAPAGNRLYIANNVDTKEWTLPKRYEKLAAYRDRMLIVDGLVNRNGNGGHFCGDLLTCCKNVGQGRPGGQSLDQHVASVLGKDTAFPSAHLGCFTGSDGWSPGGPGKLMNAYFAKSASSPVPVHADPVEAFDFYFPKGGATPAGPAKPSFADRARLLDFLTDDIKRARMALSPTERNKLDQYLSAIEDTQKRLGTLAAAAGGSCAGKAPTVIPGNTVEPDDVFEAQMEVGTSLIACGLTNVLTVSFVGIGRAFVKRFGFNNSIHNIGHGGDGKPGLKNLDSFDLYLDWFSGLLAKMIDRLASLKEGDRSVFDNSLILYASDNAESHHARDWRYPVTIFGNAGGGLRADGRYIKYPGPTPNGDNRHEAPRFGPAGQRALGDLMSALGHALGAPVDDWGKNGAEIIKGPLAEVLP